MASLVGAARRLALEGVRPPRQRLPGGVPGAELRLASVLAAACIATALTFPAAYLGYVLIEDRWPESFLSIWRRWDTLHYLRLAREGYGTEGLRSTLAMWPPLYAWLTRAAAPLFGGHLEAGLAVSFGCYVAAAAVFYRLVALDFPERVAWRSVLYWTLFPTAYFLHAAYSESLFVLLVVGSFYAARRERWALAGALGGLAALTRVTWVPLLPALAFEYLAQRGFRLRAVRSDVLWLLLIPGGFAVFLLINQRVYGNPFEFLEVARSVMKKELAWPWVGARRVFAYGMDAGPSRAISIGILEVAAGLTALFAACWTALRMRASYAVYMLVAWLVLACNSWWLATFRYWLPLFPGFVMFALWGERRGANLALCLVFGVLQTLLLTLFVRGWWTY